MRHASIDQAFVAPDERGEIQCRVVNAQTVAAAQDNLRYFDHGALAQIISVGLEGEAEDDDFGLAALGDEGQERLEMAFVAHKQALEHRQMEAILAAMMRESSHILRQA